MLTTLLVSMLSAYPEFTVFLAGMGFLRTINKPLFSLIQVAVDATETKIDNEKWNAIKKHKAMKSFMWLLDFTTSMKIPK